MYDCVKLILEKAALNPETLCVIEGDEAINYNDFISLVQIIGSYLHRNNYKKVLINMNQGVNSYAVIIATLLIGGYYCPLNLDSPEERKLYVANEFDPGIIITEKHLILPDSRLAKFNCATVPDILSEFKDTVSLDQLIAVESNEIAYIIYTSGSTGNPKGVIVKRRALNKFLDWSIRTFNCTTVDKWAQYSSLSFDLSIVDIFTALCSGCALVPLSEMGQKLRPANTVAKHQITVWHSVPGAIDFMIKNEQQKPADLSSVRLMSFCGEPLFEYHLRYLFSKNPELVIFNTYGPTEGTLFCTYIPLNSSNYRGFCEANVSIGQPIPGWNLLLEGNEEEEIKELVIHGNYLAKGYLNVHSNAFSVRNIDGKDQFVYITGDLVKQINSNLYFVGRKDNQIKLRGYRIELDEIDSWIMKYDGKKSVSIVYNDAIHSFVEGDAVEEIGLRSFLSKNIEKYKIPSYFYPIRSFPRNNNQKIDRIKLKQIIDEQGKANFSV